MPELNLKLKTPRKRKKRWKIPFFTFFLGIILGFVSSMFLAKRMPIQNERPYVQKPKDLKDFFSKPRNEMRFLDLSYPEAKEFKNLLKQKFKNLPEKLEGKVEIVAFNGEFWLFGTNGEMLARSVPRYKKSKPKIPEKKKQNFNNTLPKKKKNEQNNINKQKNLKSNKNDSIPGNPSGSRKTEERKNVTK